MTRDVVRLAILVSHPIQYFSPVFRELAKHAGIDLTVFYCSRQGLEARSDEKFGLAFAWDIPLLDGYKHKFLQSIPKGASPCGVLSLFNPGIIRELLAEHYDALVVHGYSYATCWLAFGVAKLCGTKTFLRGDPTLLRRRALWKRVVKQLVLRPFFNIVDGFLTIGSLNRQYYENFGVPNPKMFFAPFCVDDDLFGKGRGQSATPRNTVLQHLGLPSDGVVFAYVGKLYSRKAPFDLLSAFKQVDTDKASLLFVGAGETRRKLERYVATQRVANVRFIGFVNQSGLPKYYGLTDVLVLPSRDEPWGLVVNEAMASGCAVVVSDVCGCAPDLVHEGENGCTFGAGDVEGLARILRELAGNPERVRAMGRASREIIRSWSPEVCARQIAEAVKKVCG